MESLNASGGVEGAVSRAVAEDQGLRDALYSMLVEAVALGCDRGQADTETAQGDRPVEEVREADSGIGLVDWTLVNQEARDWAASYSYELVAGIDETTRKVLQSAISEWIGNSLSYAELIRQISGAFGEKRAELIASTELTRAYAAANRLAWLRGGVITEMRWKTAADDKRCVYCGQLENQVVSVESPKFSYQDGKGQTQTVEIPPAHSRCRCWLSPEVGHA